MLKQIIITVIIIVTSSVLEAEVVKLTGKGEFPLVGEFIDANPFSTNKKGVLMLHQCNADRSMYSSLASDLALAGFSSMSLDFRGYGDSVQNGVSIASIRLKATSRENYFKMLGDAGLAKYRTEDVELAYQFLVDKLGEKASISIIGASCGGTQAVLLAQKHKPNSFILFSAGMSEKTRALFQKVSDVPALMIAAQGDANTFKSLNKAFLEAENKQSRLLAYKGNGHGRPLFKQDPNLQSEMVNWFSLNSK